MLALLSYPLLVEPTLPTRMQAHGLVGRLCRLRGAVRHDGVASGARGRRPKSPERCGRLRRRTPRGQQRLLWVALAACASMLLLAVTTFLTQDVAAIPFLWICR